VGDEVVFHAAIEQLHGAVGIQQARQAPFALGGRQAGRRVVLAAAFLVEIAVEAAHRGQQARQAAAGLALAVPLGDQLAQVAAVQLVPAGDVLLLAVAEQLVQVAPVAVQRMRRQLPGAAQVFEVGV